MPTNHDETLHERYEREHRQMENRIAEPEAVRLNAQAVPDIDYEALIAAAYKRDRKWAQGTNGCIAFARGAEWFREQCLSAAPAAPQPAQPLDLGVMELAESVGLIGPESRTDDLHEAIQRFHDLIVVNASIKAAQHFADGLAKPAQQPLTFAGVAKRKLDDLKAQGYSVVGYMLARPEVDHTVTRGAIDTGGMVIWWNQQKASQPNG